ncbi:hypothetical protein KCP73_11035 [Salmonella enterica subsp. enterica]|nr:hypothetical protein KCP73_11035 [Salmonella enterica subsp. enterica]
MSASDFKRVVDYRAPPSPGHTVAIGPYGYIKVISSVPAAFFTGYVILGSWYLQRIRRDSGAILPATACGLLATAVLNINNLRDINSDRENGKTPLWYDCDVNALNRYHAACLLLGALPVWRCLICSPFQRPWDGCLFLPRPCSLNKARYVRKWLPRQCADAL